MPVEEGEEEEEEQQQEAQLAHTPPSMAPYNNNINAAPNTNLNMQQQQQTQLWDAFRAGAMWAQSQGGQMPVPGYGYGQMPPGSPMGAFFSQPPAGGQTSPGNGEEIGGPDQIGEHI